MSIEDVRVVDLSHFGKIELRGDQALWFLDQLFTQKLDDLPEGSGAESLLLTPKGKIEGYFRFFNLGDRVIGWMDAGDVAPIVEFLAGRIFSTKVEIADVTHELGLLYVTGDGSDVLSGKILSGTLPQPSEHSVAVSPEAVVMRLERPELGLAILVAADQRESLLAEFLSGGAELVDRADHDLRRAQAGWPHFGVDFDDTHLPQEAAMERAVHFEKGCYLGQEAVAMAQRGQVKRRLRRLEFSGGAKTGEVLSGSSQVGTASSAGESFGIAMLSTQISEGSEVTVGGTPALVSALPGTHLGPQVPSARDLRERLTPGPP
jgi:folate-binding protein YgfZ